MWLLIIMIYSAGSNVHSVEIPNYPNKSQCMNRGNKEKAILQAAMKDVNVVYRCIKSS